MLVTPVFALQLAGTFDISVRLDGPTGDNYYPHEYLLCQNILNPKYPESRNAHVWSGRTSHQQTWYSICRIKWSIYFFPSITSEDNTYYSFDVSFMGNGISIITSGCSGDRLINQPCSSRMCSRSKRVVSAFQEITGWLFPRISAAAGRIVNTPEE